LEYGTLISLSCYVTMRYLMLLYSFHFLLTLFYHNDKLINNIISKQVTK